MWSRTLSGSVAAQGRWGEIGEGFWGCSRNKCREHRVARQKAPVAHGKGSNRGVSGFWVGTSRVVDRKRLKRLLVALARNRLFARSL